MEIKGKSITATRFPRPFPYLGYDNVLKMIAGKGIEEEEASSGEEDKRFQNSVTEPSWKASTDSHNSGRRRTA